MDLFAGIGYFTLTYLIHAQADHVYACEWNLEAVKALKMNLMQNHVQDKCIVLQGDNRTMAPKNVAEMSFLFSKKISVMYSNKFLPSFLKYLAANLILQAFLDGGGSIFSCIYSFHVLALSLKQDG